MVLKSIYLVFLHILSVLIKYHQLILKPIDNTFNPPGFNLNIIYVLFFKILFLS